MKLSDLVVQAAILPQLESTKRDDAIRELVDALISAGAAGKELRDDFIKAIIKRENRGSTGFGHGVAVPHVKHEKVGQMAIAVGISQEGVEFNALDGQPVHSIFLLLSPDENGDALGANEQHINAMQAIFSNLNRDTFRRFLKQARNVDDVTTLLEEADANTPIG